MRKLLLPLIMILAVTVLVGTGSAYAIQDKSTYTGPSNPAAIQVISNGFLDVTYNDLNGQYTFSTGAAHSSPGTDILFPVGTGWDTVRSLDSGTDYTTEVIGGGTFLGIPAIVTTPTSVEFTWNVNNAGDVYTVKQLIQISGNTEATTNARVTTTVTNNDSDNAEVAIRHFWDYQINGDDGPLYAERTPDSAFSALEIDYMPPTHAFAAIDDNVGDPTETAAVADRADQVREVYGRWPTLNDFAYDYVSNPGANADGDSAVLFYSRDYSLAPGQTAEFWTAIAPTVNDPTGDPMVGGEFLPIDSTALLMAGMSANLSIIVPIAAGIAGVGAYYIRSRMNKE